MLLLQMHKRSRDLDEPFEKGVVWPGGAQPELFEDIVGLVVFAAIEAREKSGVVRVEIEARGGGERFNVGGNAVAFFHRVAEAENLSVLALCVTRSV